LVLFLGFGFVVCGLWGVILGEEFLVLGNYWRFSLNVPPVPFDFLIKKTNNLKIGQSQGRQSFAERLRRRQPTGKFVGGRKPKQKHCQLPSLNWFPIG
jgi:hypothetical protein